jgi:hypothetical protein
MKLFAGETLLKNSVIHLLKGSREDVCFILASAKQSWQVRMYIKDCIFTIEGCDEKKNLEFLFKGEIDMQKMILLIDEFIDQTTSFNSTITMIN